MPSDPDLFSRPIGPGADGYVTWRQQRLGAVNRLGQVAGLPLNQKVEVTLRDGVRLRGVLRLKEELLFQEEKPASGLDLVVDQVGFKSSEIESCVRID